ncbi:hypothetical protein E2C01_069467 [Portunus trituberculatus]|uniref:Uncharacterized protein n=1 Tax=Portunus trituberculatus TaxID=210409 RepID=A0A5B7HUL3_PORTR|nr:hypothetical protein [Portunus trituberculatus]
MTRCEVCDLGLLEFAVKYSGKVANLIAGKSLLLRCKSVYNREQGPARTFILSLRKVYDVFHHCPQNTPKGHTALNTPRILNRQPVTVRTHDTRADMRDL